MSSREKELANKEKVEQKSKNKNDKMKVLYHFLINNNKQQKKQQQH